MIKKFYLLAILLTAFANHGISQNINNYNFAAYSGNFTTLSGETTPSLNGSTDEGYWNAIPIGFDFWYMGIRYTTVSASTNGWLTLGANITQAFFTNDLSNGGALRPVIAPLWDDLNVQSAGNVSYLTMGTTGNRVFTIEFLNCKWNSSALGKTISFQVKLYEGTGKIEYLYRQETWSAKNASANIGITATAKGSGNFLSVNNAGTSVSSTTVADIYTKPLTGNTYSFTSPVPKAPGSLTFSGVTSASTTLTWVDLSNNETGFVIYRSTDGVNYTFVSQTPANSTTSAQTGLTMGILYYWKVYAVSEGALSATALSGTKATLCLQPAAPAVTSPVTYCQDATAIPLTATGSNLLWGGAAGSVGGATVLPGFTYTDSTEWNNRKTNFTTTAGNITIKTVDYYVPTWQAVSGLVLSIYNNSGTIIATSSTNTTIEPHAAVSKITNTFNYKIVTAGDYSIGVSAGLGIMTSDNPTFPITEETGTINVTGVSFSGKRCFNNIQFTTGTSATAPVPSTLTAGTQNYFVSQTVGGCTSPLSTIVVNVAGYELSQIPSSDLIANYKFNGNANDEENNNAGTLRGSPAQVADRFGVSNTAYNFNGSSQFVSTNNWYSNPNVFTISIWFKTATTSGGKLIGFGNEQTKSSKYNDRHIYMNNAGQIYFGVYPTTVVTVNSALSYNDDKWHMATATLSGAGMVLYVDGTQVGSNNSTTIGENSGGYWRIGYDNCNAWTSQPSSYYFKGLLDDALIYTRALTATEVAGIYNSPDGAGNSGPTCSGSTITLSATSLTGGAYAWTGPNGFSSTLQNPTLTFTNGAAGVYTVKVTGAGCTSTAYTIVTAPTNEGQWTGNISTDWANAGNWCTGVVPTAATNVVITATATRMPSVISNASCNNLTINAGATVTTLAGGTLNIAGTLTNNGTMANSGTTNFNGTTGQQTFSGVSSFYNLTLSNAAGLILPAAITINSNLLISAGTLNANNFAITMKGNWTNNAGFTAGTGPTANVTFSGTTAQVIGGTFSTTFNNLTMADTTGTVTLNANAIVNGNLSVSSGTFDLAAFTANRTSAGGSLTVANNAFLKIGGTNTFPANYTDITLVVASTVEYSGTNQTVSKQLYGNLTLSSSVGAVVKTFPNVLPGTELLVVGNLTSKLGTGTSVTFTAASDITVVGNYSIGASTTFNGGNFSHKVGGNWVNNGTFNGNAGTIIFAGPGTTVSGSGLQNFNNLTVAASQIIFSNVSIGLTGNLATISSGSFTQASGGTLTMTGSSTTISGIGISLDNLAISGTVNTAVSLVLTGNLSVSGSFTSTTGTTTMSGTAKTITGAGTKSFGSLLITGSIISTADFSISTNLTVNGSLSATAGTATFTGTSVLSGTANLFNATVNGTSLQLSASAILGIANVLTISAGTLNVTSSAPNTVNFNGTGAQNINAITYSNLIVSNGNTKTAIGAFTTNNDITIATGTIFNAATYTHLIYGSWVNNGTFTAGTSTIQFLGDATDYITGATTFNILTSNTTSTTTQLILNNNVSAAIVNMTKGVITTGSNTITITQTRNGSGYIYGNIQRTHVFTTGVDYAFEGPNNTIKFSGVTGVTSITVSVIKSAPSDFPFGGSINRVYNVTVPAGTYTATLRLHYEDGELNGTNEALMGLWNYNGSAWAAVGKTSNSTTDNYVEQSGLANITKRWTCSDDANVVQWNGSVSTDWNTAANWTVLQGSATAPPSATDIVNLGNAAFLNQPTISNTVSVKNIIFGSVQAVTLSMASGGSLASGDIQGNWSSNATHAINVNNQTVTINGDLTLSDGVTNHTINLNIGSGTVNIGDNIMQAGGANIVFTATGNLNIGGDFDYNSGTFTAGTGTVTYNGVNNQHVAHDFTYNNLTINKAAAIATIDSDLYVAGDLLISAGQLDVDSTTIITGNVTISSGAILHNQSVIQVGGNWNNTGDFNSNATNTKVIFNGSGTQTISSTNFDNLEFNKPVGSVAELTGDVKLLGNLVGTSGTLDIKSFLFNRHVKGGSATMANSATLIIAADNAPTNFSNYNMGPNSTVIFNGTGTQHLLLPGLAYGNLILRNGGLKTLYTEITVNGDLTIDNGATFDAGSNTITLNGNWINSATFIPSASTIICNGTGKNIAGNNTFNRFSVYGSYALLNNNTFDSLLTVNPSGSFSAGGTITVTMNGDFINKGTLYSLGTTTFTGTRLQTLNLINAVQTVAITVNFNGSVSPVLNSTSAPQFGYLNINNTGGVNSSVGWTVLYALTISNGASFNGGASTHNFYGSVTNNGTITSSGTLNFIPTSTVSVNLGTNFTSTGRVIFGGAGAMTLAGNSLNSFHDVVFSNTNVAGISPSFDWNVSNNFTVNNGSILNAGSHTYLVGGNISNIGTINNGTSTFTLNGSATQDIYSLSPFNNVTINNTANSVTLSSNATVNSVLNFVAGSIQTGSNLLVQPSAGTITGAAQNTGWVNGKLQKNIATGAGIKSFEIGDATSYTPVSLAFSSVNTAGNLTAFTTQGDHPQIVNSDINASKSVNRFWTLNNSGIGFTNYTATYNFVAADVDAGANTALFSVANYNGSAWSMPGTASPNPTNIQATGVTSFGDFAIGESCNKNTTISYAASPYCSNTGTASVTLTGNTDGTFSSDTSLSLDPSTGSINLSESLQGSYIVNYTVAANGGCPSFLTTANIIVTAAPSATIFYANNPYCSSAGTAAITRIGTAGGIFSSADTLVIDPITGSVDLAASSAGTYTVTYTVAANGGCSLFTTTTSITVTTQPLVVGAYEGNPYCTTGGYAIPTVTTDLGAQGVFNSSAGLSIDPTTGVIDLAASTPGIYTGTYTVPASGGCDVFILTGTVSIVPAGTWTGAVSSDWNDSRNWLCGEIPGSATNVLMDSSLSIYPIVTTSGTTNKVTIQTGGLITVNGGTLQIADSIINNGTFDATNGTIEMNGTSAQTIAGSIFTNKTIKNLIVSNTVVAGLSIASTPNDTLKITGTLSFGNSTSTLNTGDNITLVSNSTGTANVGIVGAGNSINGKATVERYINTGTGVGQHAAAWEFLSTPTTGQTVKESWMENGNIISGYGTVITSPTGIGFDRISPSPSMKYFDYLLNNYVPVSNSNNLIVNQRGYMVFVRGDRTVNGTTVTTPVPTTLRTKGTLFTGTLPAMSLAPNIYASVGNPYASPIDFALITKDATVDNAFYVWDPYLYGAYGVGGYQTSSVADGWKPVPGGTLPYPTGISSSEIQSGQGFFVHTTSNPSNINPNYTLTFSENCKAVGGGTVNRARENGAVTTSDRQFFRTSLYTGANPLGVIADGNVVAYDRAFSDGIDRNDALKLLNPGENFGLARAGKIFAIEARSPIVNTDTIYYYMSNLRQQVYQLRFGPQNMETTGLQAYLMDSYLNTSIPLSLTDSSFVNITVTSNAASSAAGRFKVVLKTMTVLPVTFTSLTATQKNANILVEWKVENESGMRQYEVEKSVDGNTFTKTTAVAANNNGSANYSWLDANVAAGYNYYRVRSIDKNGQVNYTKIVKIWIGQTKAKISVYPNPISNGVINLQLTNQPAGTYGIRLLNSLGQIIVSKEINHAEGTSIENIKYLHQLSKGIYQLEVTKPDGNVEVVKVVN